jgi:hypothetical protein
MQSDAVLQEMNTDGTEHICELRTLAVDEY